ncbi:MAG: winged helix-turn-helix transcriptional regulator [Rubrivivax sp.]|nr:winged helix-turn-helix transcriptional regulator [Rubrivivax sp.]
MDTRNTRLATRCEASDAVFASAAELFRLLATPMRLKIISALCEHEKNVSQLLAEIDTTQPNMSQHLAALYRAGVLARRRDATQIHYRIASERAATLCRAVCLQIAAELDGTHPIAPAERLVPRAVAAASARHKRPAARKPNSGRSSEVGNNAIASS